MVRKDGALYYAFFATRHRRPGRAARPGAARLRVRDYVNGRDLGTVKGPVATLDARFRQSLLLEATPQ